MFNKAKKLTKQIWWLFVLTGVAGVVFGLIALLWPGLTLASLVFIYTLFILALGVVMLGGALANMEKDRLWWLLLLLALVSIAVGVFLLRNPAVAVAVFAVLVAVYVFLQAIFDLVVASYSQKADRWLWVLTGLAGLAAACSILFYPELASLAFVWVIGVYALARGLVALAHAWRIRETLKIFTK